jgi:hypothetical protein
MTLITAVKPLNKRPKTALEENILDKYFKRYYSFRLTYLEVIYINPLTSKTYLYRLTYLAYLKRLFFKTPLTLRALKRL